MTSSAILDLINMNFDSSMTIIYLDNGRKCQIMIKFNLNSYNSKATGSNLSPSGWRLYYRQ